MAAKKDAQYLSDIDPAEVEKIYNMSMTEMLALWRFAETGHPYFDNRGPYYKIFKDRFDELGGDSAKIAQKPCRMSESHYQGFLAGWEECIIDTYNLEPDFEEEDRHVLQANMEDARLRYLELYGDK